ncbi:hypothetical protein JCM19233_198 [Vibrio astriarenae]|nr:hypothetical protein JCM19233_198 [Vibrio sp. C7]
MKHETRNQSIKATLTTIALFSLAFMSTATIAQENSTAVSTDTVRSQAHSVIVESTQDSALYAEQHQQAMTQLEQDGDVDRYMQSNGVSHNEENRSDECSNSSETTGAKIAAHCS